MEEVRAQIQLYRQLAEPGFQLPGPYGVYTYVCVCVCVCVSLYVSARLHVSIYEFVCFRMCLCVHTHILSFLCASVYLFNFAQAALMLSTEKSPSQPTHETASLPSRNILCSRQGLVLNVSGILRIQRSP